MGPPVSITMIVEARLFALQAEQCAINVLHYYCYSMVGTGADLSDVAKAIDAQWAGSMKSLMSSSATYRGCGARIIFPIPASAELYSITGQGPGTSGVDLLPRQTSGCITKQTGIAGRKYRGRMYPPFPAKVDDTAAGRPAAAYIVNLVLAAANLTTNVTATTGGNTSNLRNVLRHRAVLGSFDPITAARANQSWATQRRRGDYGKANLSPI